MRKKHISNVLKEYRKRNHYTVEDISILLRERDIRVAPKTIYGWENGHSSPNTEVFMILCDLYDLKFLLHEQSTEKEDLSPLTPQERALIEAYRTHPELQEATDILLHISSMQ